MNKNTDVSNNRFVVLDEEESRMAPPQAVKAGVHIPAAVVNHSTYCKYTVELRDVVVGKRWEVIDLNELPPMPVVIEDECTEDDKVEHIKQINARRQAREAARKQRMDQRERDNAMIFKMLDERLVYAKKDLKLSKELDDLLLQAPGRLNQPFSKDPCGRWETLAEVITKQIGVFDIRERHRMDGLLRQLRSFEEIAFIKHLLEKRLSFYYKDRRVSEETRKYNIERHKNFVSYYGPELDRMEAALSLSSIKITTQAAPARNLMPSIPTCPFTPEELLRWENIKNDMRRAMNVAFHCTTCVPPGYAGLVQCRCIDKHLLIDAEILKCNEFQADMTAKYGPNVIIPQAGGDIPERDFTGLYPNKDWWGCEQVDDDDSCSTFGQKMKRVYSYGTGSLSTVASFKDMLADVMDSIEGASDSKCLKYVRCVEDIALFYFLDLPHITSKTEAILALYRLSKNITGYSVCDSMFGWINSIIKIVNNSCDDISTQAGSDSNDDFSKFFKGEAYSQIQKLVCALCTVAISQLFLKDSKKDPSKESEETKNMFTSLWEYFKPLLRKKLKWDIVTTAFEFCKWVASRGIELLSGKKTFSSVFFDEDKAQCFDERLSSLEFLHECIETGRDDTASLETYMFEVLELETLCRKEFEDADNKVLKVTLQRQLTTIMKHKAEMLRMLESEANRPAPFGLLLYGTTSVGKTVLTSLITPVLQRAMGVKEGPQYVFNFDTNDKYMSGMTYDKDVVVLDDLANTDLNFIDKPASDFVIYLINNYRRFALKADVDSKGKIPLRPAIVIASTNKEDLNCKITSCEPLSIMRRFEYHIEVKVKDSCGTGPPGKKMMRKTNHNPNDHGFDCWLFTLYTYQPDSGAEKFRKVAVNDMINIPLDKMMTFLVKEAKAFKSRQDALVDRLKNMHKDTYCEHDIFQYLCSECNGTRATQEAVRSLPMHLQIGTMAGNKFEDACHHTLWNIGHQADRFGAWCKASSLKPEPKKVKEPMSIGSTAKLMMSLSFWSREKLAKWQFMLMSCAGVAMAPLGLSLASYCVVWPVVMGFLYASTSAARVASYMRITPYATVKEAVRSIRSDWQKSMKSIAPLAMLIGVSYGAYKLWNYARTEKITSQGCTVSMPIPKGVTGRKDPYRPPKISAPCVNIDFRTATSQQMATAIEQKLVILRFRKGDKHHEHCVSMPLCTGYWFVPYHLLLKDYDYVDIVKHDTLHTNSVRTASIKGAWRRIGETDYALMYLPVMGDQRDFRKLFPSGKKLDLKHIGARCIWLKGEGQKISDTESFISLTRGQQLVNFKPEIVKPFNLGFAYEGGSYKFPGNTWEGMCGSVVITDVNGPIVLGLHSAGSAGTSEARTCTIMRDDIDACMDLMTGKDSCQLLGVQSGNFADALNYKGTKFEYIPTHRPKATSPYVDFGSFECLGSSTAPHRTFRSSVKPTFIADTVCKIFDIKVNHGPPKYIGHWGPWNAWVSSMSHPSDVPCFELDMAYCDYRDKVHAGWQEEWLERIHPLADDAVLAGIDGLQGCYAMNFKASMGIPYCKPKGDYIKVSDRIVENISCPRDLTPELLKEITDMENELARGYRVYTPHRCCPKDEPTKLDKDKVRIFMGSAFAYQFLMRKYFLMVSIIMQENPELFECAIGVKASSLEWTRLYNHTFKFGTKRCVAGDYEKYDQKLDVKVMMAAFKILIGLCEKAGYSQFQLDVCVGLATETCMAIYDARNEWLQFNCGNSSGNPLTAVLNSIAGALLKRCVYVHLKPANLATTPFHEVVSLMTYGDDNVMSVSEGNDWFNHTALADTLKKWGMGYTMADKTSVSVPFIDGEQVEFLKRKWVWSDKYGRYLCPLNEQSIFKALTCALKSDALTVEQHSAEIIAGANLEYFFYGKEVFDQRHMQLKQVLNETKIEHHLPGGHLKTFEELEEWYISE